MSLSKNMSRTTWERILIMLRVVVEAAGLRVAVVTVAVEKFVARAGYQRAYKIEQNKLYIIIFKGYYDVYTYKCAVYRAI